MVAVAGARVVRTLKPWAPGDLGPWGAHTLPMGSAITSYDWDISIDGTNDYSGPINSTGYVGQYGNTTATSSPQTDPNLVGHCGSSGRYYHRRRDILARGSAGGSWEPCAKVAAIRAPDVPTVLPTASPAV